MWVYLSTYSESVRIGNHPQMRLLHLPSLTPFSENALMVAAVVRTSAMKLIDHAVQRARRVPSCYTVFQFLQHLRRNVSRRLLE